VRADGPTITIRINGVIVESVRDDTYPQGQFGFGVGHFKDGTAEARFDNLPITGIGQPGVQAASTAASATPGPATPTPYQSASLEQLVRDYYQAIDQRRYADAYAYLSRAEQGRQSFADFERQFSRTLVSIKVRSIDMVSMAGTSASLAAHTATVSQEGVRQVPACWRVDWRLVQEDGRWKRDAVSQTAESCTGG
jgi:hypothetical protein